MTFQVAKKAWHHGNRGLARVGDRRRPWRSWSLVWFLISGWVSALLQIALLVATVYFFKYGWQRAPSEIWARTCSFGRFFWSWLRAREPEASPKVKVQKIVRIVRAKEFGDINISALLSLLVLIGLALLTKL